MEVFQREMEMGIDNRVLRDRDRGQEGHSCDFLWQVDRDREGSRTSDRKQVDRDTGTVWDQTVDRGKVGLRKGRAWGGVWMREMVMT